MRFSSFQDSTAFHQQMHGGADRRGILQVPILFVAAQDATQQQGCGTAEAGRLFGRRRIENGHTLGDVPRNRTQTGIGLSRRGDSTAIEVCRTVELAIRIEKSAGRAQVHLEQKDEVPRKNASTDLGHTTEARRDLPALKRNRNVSRQCK